MTKPQPARSTTITTSQPHDVRTGDWISITMRDTRWWRRLWFRMLGRGEPQRTVKLKVISAGGSSLCAQSWAQRALQRVLQLFAAAR